MIKFILTFLLGSMIGGSIGVFLMAIIIGGKEDD